MSLECSFCVERHLSFEDVKRSAGKLVGHGVDRDDLLRLRCLLVVVALRIGVVAHREVGRFVKRPTEVRVAVLRVVPGLHLAVREPLGIDAATVGGEVADRAEPLHRAGLVHDRETEDLPDASAGLDKFELLSQPRLLQHAPLEELDLLIGAHR
jgi:hypothetical protein